MAVIVIATVIHDVPGAHAIDKAVGGVVKIGQSQAMAELVAEGAHTINICTGVGTAFQFIEDGEFINPCFIEQEGPGGTVTPVITLLHVPLARPDRLGHSAPGLSLAHASKQHNHNVNQAIAVVIIVGKIHTLVNALTSLDDHVSQMHVIAAAVVPAIIGAGFAQLNGSYYLKFW